MNKRLDFSLILPCYNEELIFDHSVKLIIDTLQDSRYSFEILFVDDGSVDATRKRIQKACRIYPFCTYIFHPHTIGRGGSVADGIRRSRGEVVGYIDIDCEVSPVYLPRMISLIKSGIADIVVGTRIYRTGFSSLVRFFASVGYKMMVGFLFKTKGIDTESGYKVLNKKKFLPVLTEIQSTGWFWDTECIVLSQKKGLRIVGIPVLFIRRFDKKSTVHVIHDSWEYIKNIWKLYWRMNNG